jgi:type IV fimbrial biogenesis protein FimU
MKKIQSGFTLVELMVTIAVAAILLAIGVPSLTSLYENARVNNNIDKIQGILVFARNQAINYGTTVNVCSFATATTCGATADWSGGIRVFVVDANNVKIELRVIDNFNDSDKVKGPSNNITFTADGLSSDVDIIYCPSGKTDLSKSVSVSNSGRVSYGSDGSSCSI